MPVIVTVHGTFERGPERGSKWWQIGSAFTKRLEDRLTKDKRSGEILPFIWDGENSEKSRRKAGRELLTRCLELEKANKQYVIIGHSHGGSIISHALLYAAQSGHQLPNLVRWLTIGTPFIQTDVRVGSRRGMPSEDRALSMSLALAAICVLALRWIPAPISDIIPFITFGHLQPHKFSNSLLESSSPLSFQDGALITIAAAMLFLASQFRPATELQKQRAEIVSKQNGAKAALYFEGRWLGFTHKTDEAVGLLSKIQSISLSKLVFSPLEQGWSILLLPVALGVALAALLLSLNAGIKPSLQNIPSIATFYFTGDGVVGTLLLSLAIISATLALYLALHWLATRITRIRDTWSDSAAIQLISRLAIGLGFRDEKVIQIASNPYWASRRAEIVDDETAKELLAFDDANDAFTLRRVRAELHNYIASGDNSFDKNAVSEAFNVLDLIHTNYFRSERFTRIIQERIASSFLSTASDTPMNADPD